MLTYTAQYLMVDVAPNHMASDSAASTVQWAQLNPFNQQSYFHSLCWITDWNNQTEVEMVSSAGVV